MIGKQHVKKNNAKIDYAVKTYKNRIYNIGMRFKGFIILGKFEAKNIWAKKAFERIYELRIL